MRKRRIYAKWLYESVASEYMLLFCKLNDAPVVTLNDAITV